MIPQSSRQRDDRQRGIGVPPTREDGAAGDEQVRRSVDPAVLIHDAVPGRHVHPGGSHVVLAGLQRLPPRRRRVRKGALQMADAGLPDRLVEELRHAAHVLDVRLTDPPLDAYPAPAEAVSLVAQHHAVVVPEPGLEGRTHSPASCRPMSHRKLACHRHGQPVRGSDGLPGIRPGRSRHRSLLDLVPQRQQGLHLRGREDPMGFVAGMEEQGRIHEALALHDLAAE